MGRSWMTREAPTLGPPRVDARLKRLASGDYRVICGRVAGECRQDLGTLRPNDDGQPWRLTLPQGGGLRRREDRYYERVRGRLRYPVRVPHVGITLICPYCQSRNTVRSDIHVGGTREARDDD